MKIKRILSLLLTFIISLTALGVQTTAAESRESKPFSMGVLFSPEDSLDPATVTSPGGMVLLFSVYDSLATMSQDGMDLRMAKSIEANEDYTVYTVTLKDNLIFSDGTDVTGEDVLKSLNHLAKSHSYQSIYGNLDTEKSKAEEKRVHFVLKEPASDFVESSIGMFSPVAKDGAFDGVGAGAYLVEKGDPLNGFVLKANEKYYAGKPSIPQVTILNVPDSSSRVKALQTGEIDYAWGLDGAAIQVLSKERDIELPSGSLDGALALELVLNTRVEPFNDPELRKAAKLTVDREKLIKTILGEYGEVGNDMLGKGFETYPTDVEQIKVDKEEAKRIFARKGLQEFTIVSSDLTPGLNKATEMMVQDFKEVGVHVKVEQIDPQVFFAQMGEIYQKAAFTFYWVNRTPLAEFRSQILKDSIYNVSGYYSENTEKKFLEATTTNDESQSEAIQELSREIHDLGGDLIWGYQMDISAKRKGFEAPLTESVPWLAEATFIPEEN